MLRFFEQHEYKVVDLSQGAGLSPTITKHRMFSTIIKAQRNKQASILFMLHPNNCKKRLAGGKNLRDYAKICEVSTPQIHSPLELKIPFSHFRNELKTQLKIQLLAAAVRTESLDSVGDLPDTRT
jgi:hypothetical protein